LCIDSDVWPAFPSSEYTSCNLFGVRSPLSGPSGVAFCDITLQLRHFQRTIGHLLFTRSRVFETSFAEPRYRWVANSYRIWTSCQRPCRQVTISETPSFAWRTNVVANVRWAALSLAYVGLLRSVNLHFLFFCGDFLYISF
jgi:hypothetical protein